MNAKHFVTNFYNQMLLITLHQAILKTLISTLNKKNEKSLGVLNRQLEQLVKLPT